MIEPSRLHSSTALHDKSLLPGLEEERLSGTKHAAQLDDIVWEKLDRWMLPICTIFYLLAAVDRSNIANARIVGLQRSLAISNYQYTLALTVTYNATRIPIHVAPKGLNPDTTNGMTGHLQMVQRVGPNIMLPTMATLWGVASASQGSLPPGLLLYLSFFYPRRKLQIRITVYLALGSLASAFSGLLAAAINELDGKGGKPGWAWIFILEGIISIVFGVISFFLLPSTPEKAPFLTEEEREYVISALKRTGIMSEDDRQDGFNWIEVTKSIKSPHLWLLAPVFFFSGAHVYGLTYFEPTIVVGLGYKGNQAQLMSVPPFAVASILAFISAFLSDHYQCRGFAAIFFSLLEMIGFTMFHGNLTVTSHPVSTSNHVRYGSLFFSVPGSICSAPALATWLVNNSAPHARRATCVAITFVLIELGAMLATWLLGWLSPAPDHTTATIVLIAMATGMVLFSTINLAYVWRENQRKAERRRTMREEDEPKDLGDRGAWFIYSL